MKREAGGQGEFSVGLRPPFFRPRQKTLTRDTIHCDPWHDALRPVTRKNGSEQNSARRSLLGGTHAMKSMKPSVDILEVLSNGFKLDVSAPHLIRKWLH
jgi:hypothetical protein